jgi:hypothetical protein
MEVKLWNELNDQVAENISGGYANPENNGSGSENSGINGVIAVNKSTSTSEISPNSPKYEGFGGVANSDHYFQSTGLIG